MKLTVIIPTSRRPKLLDRCLGSLSRVPVMHMEVIIVSDMHDSETLNVIDRWRASIKITFMISEHCRGPAESRNLALDVARGQYVHIMDDDDEYIPEAFAGFFYRVQRDNLEIAYSNAFVRTENRKTGEVSESDNHIITTDRGLEDIWTKNFIFTQSTLFRRDVIGGQRQDIHMRSLEDWEFLLGLMGRGAFTPLSYTPVRIYKDYTNLDLRRGSSAQANDKFVFSEYAYVYYRRPAPTEKIASRRRDFLADAGCKWSGDLRV